jgi:hypothetical protein
MDEQTPQKAPRLTAAAHLQLADVLRYLEAKLEAAAAKEPDAFAPGAEGHGRGLEAPRADEPRPAEAGSIRPRGSHRRGHHDRHGKGGR